MLQSLLKHKIKKFSGLSKNRKPFWHLVLFMFRRQRSRGVVSPISGGKIVRGDRRSDGLHLSLLSKEQKKMEEQNFVRFECLNVLVKKTIKTK